VNVASDISRSLASLRENDRRSLLLMQMELADRIDDGGAITFAATST